MVVSEVEIKVEVRVRGEKGKHSLLRIPFDGGEPTESSASIMKGAASEASSAITKELASGDGITEPLTPNDCDWEHLLPFGPSNSCQRAALLEHLHLNPTLYEGILLVSFLFSLHFLAIRLLLFLQLLHSYLYSSSVIGAEEE